MRRKKRLPLIISVISCFLIFLSNVTVLGQTRQQIAQSAFPSVVLLMMEDENGQPISLESDFFVREGVIATNLHVVEKAARGYAKIIGQRTKHDIEGIIGIDSGRDLVLLSIPSAKAPLLLLGDSDKVNVGDEVYVIGNPQGLEGTFSQGIVSGIRKVGTDTLLQITAPISPGSSGGPVLNSQGKVIGVAVATFKGGQNLNFAIPVSYLSTLWLLSVLEWAKSKMEPEMNPVMPLPGKKANLRKEKSILHGLGGRSTEGVSGGAFAWKFDTGAAAIIGAEYSFSLRNRLREPVKNVYCLIVFYGSTGEPIDIDVVQYREVILAGLAKRVLSKVDGSVQRLMTTGEYTRTLSTKVEFRILDFQILE